MSTPPQWTIHEAAILLDEFLKAHKGLCTRNQAIKRVSSKLRQRAVNNGNTIDDIFRNENGITFQLASLESAYMGRTILKPPTRLFTEIVSLYRSDYSKYSAILEEALSQAESPNSSKNKADGVPTENNEGTPAIQKDEHKEKVDSCSTKKDDLIIAGIRRILMEECSGNPAGTTVTYLQTKIGPQLGIIKHSEIKKVLENATWAKYRYGRWHYIGTVESAAVPVTNENNGSSIISTANVRAQATHKPAGYSGNNLKDMFAEYLMRKYSNVKVSEMFAGLAEADAFLTSFKIVTDTIFNTADYRLLVIACEAVLRDKTFRSKHKNEMLTIKNAFREYINFYKSLSTEVIQQAVANGKKNSHREHVISENKPVDLSTNTGVESSTQITTAKKTEEKTESVIESIYPNDPRNLDNASPISFAYFGDKQGVCTWEELLVKVASVLHDDYPGIFDEMVGTSLVGDNNYDIGNSYHYFKMIAPKAVTPGKYIETKYTASDIMRRIKALLEKCSVDYDNLVINITLPKNQLSSQSGDAKSLSGNIESNDAVKESRVQYIAWMQSRGRQSATIFSYLSALKRLSEICIEQGYTTTDLLLVTDPGALNRISVSLSNSLEYRRLNIEQHNRFSAAFSAYISFRTQNNALKPEYKADTQKNISKPITNKTNGLTRNLDRQVLANFTAVLRTNFEDGLRPGKAIDRNRFVMYYADMFGQESPVSGDELVRTLLQIGTLRDERIFVKDDANKTDLIDEIIAAVMDEFNKGASCISIECLHERFNSSLASTLHIYNAEALEEVILKRARGSLKKWFTYLQSSRREPDPSGDVIEYMKTSHLPVSYSELQEQLWYIRFDKIKQILVTTPSMVNVASEKYLYAPNLPVSEIELQKITEMMNRALLQRGYIVDSELIQIIEDTCPSVLMNTQEYPTWGLRNALAYLLRDNFSFRGAIISNKDEEVCMSEVFADFCRRSEQITIDELRQFASELNTVIYWDSVYCEMVRVGPNEFVRRDRIHFDIEHTDLVLDHLIQSAYTPIKSINLFLHFPAIDVPWNKYVLESYVAHYSKKFRLLHASFAATDCCGAIVRRDSGISDYRSLIVDVLAKNTDWKNSEEALRLLVDLGYQQRKSYSDIERVLQEANAQIQKT